MPGKVFSTLLEYAQQQYGFVTPEDARELGIDPAQLRLMVARHTIERRDWGLYRMPEVPATGLDAYMEAVLWSGKRGFLSHATALDLLGLCDVNPAAIHLTVPPRFRTRKEVPPAVQLHRAELGETETGWFEGIPIVSAERAIRDGIADGLGWELLDQAITTARERGLVTAAVARKLRAARPRPVSLAP